MKKLIAPLTQVESDVLRELAEGKQMLATRIYPHPHRVYLEKLDGKTETTTKRTVSRDTVDRLLRMRLVDAKPRDHPKCDTIDYTISRRGAESVRLNKVLDA